MLRKKLSTLLIVLLVMMQSMYTFGPVPQVDAAAISSNIIDSVSMAVYDKTGHVVTEDVYEQGSKVQLDYRWSLPSGHGYKNGDTFTFKLPVQFKLYNDIPEQPLLSGGDAIGKFMVNKDTHEVVMTLQTIEHLSDVSGTLTFQTLFDTDIIKGSTTQVIKIPIHGGEQVFTLHFKPNVSSTIEKKGVPKGYNAKSIDWTVDVNKQLSVVQHAVMTDPIPAGLNTPVSVAVYGLDMNLDGTAVQGGLIDGSQYTVSTTGNVLKVSFTDSPIRTAYRIQFTTPVIDMDKISFVNTATFQGTDTAPVNATATVNVQRGAPLDKSSTKYDAATQTIDWEIKYNYNEKTIAQANAFVADLFNDSQELVANSIHVYPVSIGLNGAETLGGELQQAEYTITPETAAGKTGFKLGFHQDISSAYKIKYQTRSVSRVLDNATITNQATSGSGDNKTATRGISQVVIVKSVGAADYAAKRVAWNIVVNQDSQPMNSVVLADLFPNQGLHLIPDTLTVREGSSQMSASDYSVDTSVPVDQGLTITFNRALNGPVTISYQTDFNLDWLSGNAVSFVNSAAIHWLDSSSNEQSKTVSATFVPRDEVKNNGFKSGVYNASTKQITWTVGLNYNGRELTAATVQDSLESGQKLVENSLSIYNMNIPANGNPTQGTVVDSTYYSYSVSSDNKLLVTFLQPISAPYYIVFKTSLDGKLIANRVGNTAAVFDGAEPASKSLTASVTIPNGGEYVNKSGKQSGDKIDWTILINRGQSTVADAKIIDTPSENQLLLPDTFKLYTTKVIANGTVSKDAELVKDTDYKLEFTTDEAGKQSFVLSFLKQLSTAAMLEYQSLIVAKDQDAVANKIAFSGNNEVTVTKDTYTSIVVGVTSGSGTINGIRGTLTVTKVDAANSNVKLEGAAFELYRKSGSDKLLISTLTTDSSGLVTFHGLPTGDYVVREKSAPTGYVLDDKEYPVKIDSSNGIQMTVTNTRVVNPPTSTEGTLTVKKVDSTRNELLLSGSTFELYKKSGANLTLISAKTTDTSGLATFNALSPGDYVVRETIAPIGYILDNKEYPITIQSEVPVQLTVTNTRSSSNGGSGGSSDGGSGGSSDGGSSWDSSEGSNGGSTGGSSGSGSSTAPSTTPNPTTTNPALPNPTTPNPTAPNPTTTPVPAPIPSTEPAPPSTAEPAPTTEDTGDTTTDQDTFLEGDAKVPLGGSPNKPAAAGAALPVTGESDPIFIQLSGLLIVLLGLGSILQRKFTRRS